MSEEQPTNESMPVNQENQEVLPPEAQLEAANQRVANGTASAEDQALVQGANIVAATMAETPASSEPRPVEDRVIVNDLYGPVTRQIPVLEDNVATATFGGDQASAQQELKTAQDMKTYLEGRDYTDAKGKLHDAETGAFKSMNDANARPESQTQTYESMTSDQLISKLADSLEHGDRTTSIDVQDALMEKVIAMSGATDDVKERLLDSYIKRAEAQVASTSDNPADFKNDSAPTEPTTPEVEPTDPEDAGDSPESPAPEDSPAGEEATPTPEVEPTNPEDAGDSPADEEVAETAPTSESEIDPTDPMHPGYAGYGAGTPEGEGVIIDGGGLVTEESDPTGTGDEENVPEENGEGEGTSERDQAIEELQQNIDRLREMVESLPIQKILAELDRVQQVLERLRNGESGESGEEEEEEEEEVEPTEEMAKSPEAAAAESRIAYYEASSNYAKAKIAAEGMFAGAEKKAAFETAGAALKEAREKWLNAEADLVRSADRIGEDLQDINNQERAEAQGMLDTYLKEKEDAGDDYDGSLEAQIAEQQATLDKISMYDGLIAEHIASREARIQEFATSELTELSKRVDDEMLAERTRRHPKLTKINNWLQKHPKTRIGVGLGLTAMGVVGAATFNAPLVAFATGAKAGLSGYGSYNASRGIGEMIASKKMNKTQLATIDDYLGASDKQSATRRNSKRIGSAVAIAMAAAPAILAMTETHHAASAVQHKPTATPTTTPAAAPPPAPSPMPTITPQGGDEYPWTFGMNNLGTNISAHDTLTKITNNPYGISFVGNGMGGGSGAIESVTIPGQGTFTDFAHINGAIAAIMGK